MDLQSKDKWLVIGSTTGIGLRLRGRGGIIEVNFMSGVMGTRSEGVGQFIDGMARGNKIAASGVEKQFNPDHAALVAAAALCYDPRGGRHGRLHCQPAFLGD